MKCCREPSERPVLKGETCGECNAIWRCAGKSRTGICWKSVVLGYHSETLDANYGQLDYVFVSPDDESCPAFVAIDNFEGEAE